MRKLRVHMSQMTFQWLCIVVMAGVILWLIYGVNAAQRHAAGNDLPTTTRIEESTPVTPVVKPENPTPKKHAKHAQKLGRESAVIQSSAAAPIPEVRGVQVPAPQPVPVARYEAPPPAPVPMPAPAPSSALGRETNPPVEKKYGAVEDGTYRARVVRCSDAGGTGPWSGWSNGGKLCLDVGDQLMKVKFDGQIWVTQGDRRWKPTQLEVNDVIRVRVNDGTMVKAELLSNVREE
jgi:hypothetical protein